MFDSNEKLKKCFSIFESDDIFLETKNTKHAQWTQRFNLVFPRDLRRGRCGSSCPSCSSFFLV